MPKVLENWEKDVKFDVYRVNTRMMNQFFKSVTENDFEMIAAVFSKTLVSLPKEWGDPSDVDNLLDTIPYPCMREMLNIFTDAFKDTQKN